MELKILSYTKENKLHVDSKYGEFIVDWDGELPFIGEAIDVELDIDRTLNWNVDIHQITNEKFQIEHQNEKTIIRGILDEVSDDGFTTLRLEDDIITFVSYGEPFIINCNIQIEPISIKAYPVKY